MTLPRVGTRRPARLLAAACALSLLVAACGDDDDATTDETTEPADETTTTADDTTESEPADSEPADESSTTAAEEPTDEGDPEAVGLAESINLTIDDFAEGWTAEESSEESDEDDIDQCFTTVDLAATTVGEAETPTFTIEAPDGQSAQVVSMQTVVLDSPDSATAVLAELATPEFATCARDLLLVDTPDATGDLTPVVDDPPLTEESVGVAGGIQIPGADGQPQQGLVDLHAFRTAEVVSFTATLDIGGVGFEQTLQELYTVIADRHAAEIG